LSVLADHPAVQRRISEFWQDDPSVQALEASGLRDLPLLKAGSGPHFNPAELTAKEQLLFETLQAYPGQVCSKDALIRAVWPEDQIYDAGVRDDSLAQLVRRLRVKMEVDPSNPQVIKTVPGRGYLYDGIKPGVL
jgi:DNA-binding response OmpR family regulator